MKFTVETMDGYGYVTIDYIDARHLRDSITMNGELIICENNVLIHSQYVKIILPIKEKSE